MTLPHASFSNPSPWLISNVKLESTVNSTSSSKTKVNSETEFTEGSHSEITLTGEYEVPISNILKSLASRLSQLILSDIVTVTFPVQLVSTSFISGGSLSKIEAVDSMKFNV